MGGSGVLFLRFLVVLATVASVLVPAWVAPARTISVPTTLTRTVELDRVVARRSSGSVPLAFRPTHLAFSWSGPEDLEISYRTEPTGEWAEAPIAHDADAPNRHYTSVLAVDRPDTLEWRVLPGDGVTVTDVVLDYLNTLDGPRAEREIPAAAAAEARTPKIVTRAEWGADESLKRTSGGCRREFHPARQLFVHHTAGSNFDERPKATMRAIYWYHVARQGWCDIGYNFVVSYDGRIFEGRWARDYDSWEVHDGENRSGEVVTGAHVNGFNSGSVGVSVMGNFQTASPSPATRRALAELLAWEVDRQDLKPRGVHDYSNPETGQTTTLPWIAGHRDADKTACPGDRLYRRLNAVRRDVAAVIGDGKVSTSVTATASAERIAYGGEVTIAGYLTDADGVALASRTIRTYLRRGTNDWVEGPTTVTGPDGAFTFTRQPRSNLTLAAIYDGDSTTWGSDSKVTVKVEPILTFEAREGAMDGAGVSHYGPGTKRVRLTGTVMPRHAGSTVNVVVKKLQTGGTYERVDEGSAELEGDGAFLFDWKVVDPGAGGSYQAHVLFPKDDDHARGVGPTVSFVIDPEP